MNTERLTQLLETIDFKNLRTTLFQIAVRDAMNNSELWRETELDDDIIEIYNLLDELEGFKESEKTTKN